MHCCFIARSLTAAQRLSGGARWIAIILFAILAITVFASAEETPPRDDNPPAPVIITADIARLLELGKLLMGQNNPAYAPAPDKLSFEQRNSAGEQALRTFQDVVKREPRLSEGWLWLGIAYTENLRYSKEFPHGHPIVTEAVTSDGIEAFRKAYECDPANEDCVKYYGDALIEYRKDFDAALKLWEKYLTVARTDLQKVIAYVQAARACLNKAYFGKVTKLPPETVKQYYQQAVDYQQQALKLCPNARDVKEMQQLLARYRKLLLGK
jgi:tetratricopeptide (TPR) repeat protein